LEVLIDAELVSADRLAPLLDECNELMAIAATIGERLKSQAN
jgi:hypothetical protein